MGRSAARDVNGIGRAQAVLDRCHGDVEEALTYAAFRRPLAALLAQTHPETLRDALGLPTKTHSL